MKRILAFVMCLIMVLSLTACGGSSSSDPEPVNNDEVSEDEAETEDVDVESPADEKVNMVVNGDFSLGTENWFIFTTNGGDAQMAVDDEGVLKVDVNSTGDVEHGVQLYYDGFELITGCEYRFSFDVYGSIERNVEWRLQINGGDYHAYASDRVGISKDGFQTVSCDFTMEESSDPAPRLCVNMGKMEEDPDNLEKHTVYFDNFSIELTDDSNMSEGAAGVETPDIQVNQVGYLPEDEKVAVVREGFDLEYSVVNKDTNEEVYKGNLTDKTENENAGETNAYFDFSGVKDEGTYIIRNSEGAESYEFKIGEDVYDELLCDLVRMFYLQRCGMELSEDLAGSFAHSECHREKAVVYGTDKEIDVSGGWHDAGDYGRYVVAGSKAVMDLMLAYKCNPDIFKDDTGIPESGNNVPDILDECRYELEWMLKMQDKESGGVYHKVTCANFPGSVLPEEETEQLILSPISSTSTGVFSAVMAKAYLVYKDIDIKFAKKCLAASKKAYKYLEGQPGGGGFKNPEDIVTGEYPDDRDVDERIFAAVELYLAENDSKYKEYIESEDLNAVPMGLGWADVGTYGFNEYLTGTDGKDDISDAFKGIIKQQAEGFVESAAADGYGCTLGGNYPWGSNMSVANNGIILAMAQNLKIGDYDTLIKTQLDYILGRNANSYCFVTGYGSLSPKDPHHRPSMVVGEPMKGMVIGGPDNALEDPYAKAVLADKPPAKCYADSGQSYSCNEITIYWNSPVVYLLANVLKK